MLASARSACPDPTVSGVGTAYLWRITLTHVTVYMGHPVVPTWELKRAIFKITNAKRLFYLRTILYQATIANDLGVRFRTNIRYGSRLLWDTRRIVAPTVFRGAHCHYHRLFAKDRHSPNRTSMEGDTTIRTTRTTSILLTRAWPRDPSCGCRAHWDESPASTVQRVHPCAMRHQHVKTTLGLTRPRECARRGRGLKPRPWAHGSNACPRACRHQPPRHGSSGRANTLSHAHAKRKDQSRR